MEILKILMLEDLPEDIGLIEHVLKKEGIEFISHYADTKEEYVRALDDFQPDVILSDHALPQFNSVEALSICRKNSLNIPFILVTGTVSEEFAVSCLKQGALRYDHYHRPSAFDCPRPIRGERILSGQQPGFCCL